MERRHVHVHILVVMMMLFLLIYLVGHSYASRHIITTTNHRRVFKVKPNKKFLTKSNANSTFRAFKEAQCHWITSFIRDSIEGYIYILIIILLFLISFLFSSSILIQKGKKKKKRSVSRGKRKKEGAACMRGILVKLKQN
ncbi:hypothetical protein AHAS_AhasUnG0030900 [Arachis hypogaea]